MLLKSYAKEIFRPQCNPSFQSLHCIAHLDQGISEVLPYLNAWLGGFAYFMVFATLVAQGVKGSEDCPPLTEDGRIKLNRYMNQFHMET